MKRVPFGAPASVIRGGKRFAARPSGIGLISGKGDRIEANLCPSADAPREIKCARRRLAIANKRGGPDSGRAAVASVKGSRSDDCVSSGQKIRGIHGCTRPSDVSGLLAARYPPR